MNAKPATAQHASPPPPHPLYSNTIAHSYKKKMLLINTNNAWYSSAGKLRIELNINNSLTQQHLNEQQDKLFKGG